MHEYLEFLRYCIDESLPLPENAKNIDWKRMMEWAEKQAVVGICFSGIERLKNSNIKVSFPVLMEWIGYANRIEQQNRLVNKRCIEVVREFKSKGFECCVLKGQGNAMLYPVPLRRSSGDIDLLVYRGRNVVKQYVKDKFPHTKTAYQHIDYSIFNDVPVEIHYLPTYLNNPFYNHRLQEWYVKMSDRGCQKECELPEEMGMIPVPTVEFNVVFQLAHMLHHLFDEGIGLRQMIDYYYLLRKGHDEGINGSGIY